MENIFFNSVYAGFEQTLIISLSLFSAGGGIFYGIYLLLSKLLYKKSKQRNEISLRLSFLWALFVFFIFFNVYLFTYLYRVGFDNMNFSSVILYLGLLPQMFIYLVVIILFFVKSYSLKKILNINSLN